MNSLAISDYKLKENVSLWEAEPVVVSGWKDRSVEILTKTALVCGSVLAGSVFATASAIYAKIISGAIMIGFAALAVARWVSSPLVNRVSIPENANQAIEAQSIPLDRQVDEIENISISPAADLPWYKDGKKVAGAAAGVAVLGGLSALAFYQLGNQSPVVPPVDDEPLSEEALANAKMAKSFVEHLLINNALFNRVNNKAYVGPAISEYLENAFWLSLPPKKTEALLITALPKPQYKLCQDRNPTSGRLEGCRSVENPDQVFLEGNKHLCEVKVDPKTNKWKPLNCTRSSDLSNTHEGEPSLDDVLEDLFRTVETENEQVEESKAALDDISNRVGGIMDPQRLLK